MDDQQDEPEGTFVGGTALATRRRVLQLLAGAGVAAVAAACGASKGDASSTTTDASSTTSSGSGSTSSTAGSTSTASSTATGAASSLEEVPEETAGPYPGDGSNGLNVLTQDGVIRSDIRSSFGSSTTTAAGVPTTVTFTLLDVAGGAPVAGAAVYLWHCDRDGQYSGYTSAVKDENYLRGVQVTDADGKVTFTTIFPACYSGRWPHMHFEVYPDEASITSASNKIATSQLALPEDTCQAVYASDGYSQSVRNLAQVSLTSDMVFRDGADLETPTVSGGVDQGYAITFRAAVKG